MFPGHGQGGDVHGDAAVHVECPDQEETAATDDGSDDNVEEVLMLTPLHRHSELPHFCGSYLCLRKSHWMNQSPTRISPLTSVTVKAHGTRST